MAGTPITDPRFMTWCRGLDTPQHRPFDAATRLQAEEFININHAPRFQISREARFFTIGSCFARNIEAVLQSDGFEVLSLRLKVPPTALQNHRHPAGLLTKFNTFSMRTELDVAFGEQDLEGHGLIEVSDGKFWDPQLHHLPLLDIETATEVRRNVGSLFRSVVDADVCIITLGLTEMWRDKVTGLTLNDAPYDWRFAKASGRFEFCNPSYEEVRDNVFSLCESISRHGRPGVRVIVTVSPVPLQRTFSGRDIIVANHYSKSTLRAAAEVAQRAFEFVDYYPSYEMVTFSRRELAWMPDQRHVHPALVAAITRKFVDLYMLGTH